MIDLVLTTSDVLKKLSMFFDYNWIANDCGSLLLTCHYIMPPTERVTANATYRMCVVVSQAVWMSWAVLEVSEQTLLSLSTPTDGASPQHLGGNRDRVNAWKQGAHWRGVEWLCTHQLQILSDRSGLIKTHAKEDIKEMNFFKCLYRDNCDFSYISYCPRRHQDNIVGAWFWKPQQFIGICNSRALSPTLLHSTQTYTSWRWRTDARPSTPVSWGQEGRWCHQSHDTPSLRGASRVACWRPAE